MYLEISGVRYPCTAISDDHAGTVMFAGVTGLTEAPTTGAVVLCTDDGFELRTVGAADYKRQALDGTTLTLTNAPAPATPTEAELLAAAQAAAVERISGKCSAAIYAGVTVNGKLYTLSKNQQDALAIAQSKVDKGATAVIYGGVLTDAATITALSQAAYECVVVNTTYDDYLKKYIAVETDAGKLTVIDYGKALPDSNMQQLTALLSSAGIDITKYGGMFTA